jgi:diaminopimelate epimerase
MENKSLVSFSKYHGIGNDFILIDNRCTSIPLVDASAATRLCNRHTGVGADGVIMLISGCDSESKSKSRSDFTMKIINSDGSEPEMCGNGIRCLAQFIKDIGSPIANNRITIDTLAGLREIIFQSDGSIQVDMGAPRLAATQIPTTLSTGSLTDSARVSSISDSVMNAVFEVGGRYDIEYMVVIIFLLSQYLMLILCNFL